MDTNIKRHKTINHGLWTMVHGLQSHKMICKQVTVKGKVQGVYFRASAREVAELLGLAGEVRNLLDGDVRAIVEGPQEKVEKFIAWCREGPPGAKVLDVKIVDMPLGGYKGFYIAR